MPHSRLFALVGELEAVGGDARAEDAEGFAQRGGGFVAVPDLAGVELAALGGCAEQRGVLANHRGGGVRFGFDVLDVVHDCLLAVDGRFGPFTVACSLRRMSHWDTRAQRSHRGRNEWPVVVREWCGRRERSD